MLLHCRLPRHAVLTSSATFCSHRRPSSPPFGSLPTLLYLGVHIVVNELLALVGILSGGRENAAGYRECAQDLLSPETMLEHDVVTAQMEV